MFRQFFVVGVVFLAALAPLAAQTARAAPQSAAELLDVPRLLDELSHTDTKVRNGASEKLAAIGDAARPELIKAARSDDPEQRVRAAELLRKLPWFTEKDPQPVRALLERYGPADDRTRMALLWQMSESDSAEVARVAADVLLRLLAEEPSESIRWFIAALLTNQRDLATQKKVLALEPALEGVDGRAAHDAPVLVLVGNALMERDRRKALDLFRRAIEAEESRPGPDIGVLAIAFDALTDDAISRGDFDAAAALLRRQVPRDDMPHMAYRRSFGQSAPHALARLMALHAYFGPLRDYARDLGTWGDGKAVALPLDGQISLLMSRFGAPPPLPWQARELTGEQHLAAGAFLLRNKLNGAAEMELHRALAAPEKENPLILEANTLFALGQVTADRGDDDAAANFLERAMHIKRNNLMVFSAPSRRHDDDVWAEIHWRRARAAAARGDDTAANARVKDLVRLTPTNTDLTISIIEWLKQSSREADGKTLFEKVYVQADAKLQSATAQEKAGMKNDLAWLCARVDERLEEALKLAHEAVEAQPDNAAYLDTLAEACFRSGRADLAVEYEQRALELEPDNEFMKQQLERFRGGSGDKGDPPPR